MYIEYPRLVDNTYIVRKRHVSNLVWYFWVCERDGYRMILYRDVLFLSEFMPYKSAHINETKNAYNEMLLRDSVSI